MQSTMGGRIATGHAMGLSSDPGVRVNIGGVGSYLYNSPTPTTPLSPSSFSTPRPSIGFPQGKKTAELRGRLGRWHHLRFTGPPHMKTFTGETSLCPGCEEPVYFAEKVMSLGRNWHRPCLRCQRCRKTLTAGSHAEHDGVPYCHIPCYGYLFGPKGGQPHSRHVGLGDLWTTSWVVKHVPGPSQFPPALSPAPPATSKAHGDKALSLRCEHW
ncbi:cysteine-rich protein 3 isoform X1 [Manis javanica]|uniref:cysteine-rich protein 3 isoform X1 n=1 Tax=Manis javanica TaxID=9974 RepID=UPI003C6D4C43